MLEPHLKKGRVIRLHQLKASVTTLLQPAVHVDEPVRQHSSLLMKAFIDPVLAAWKEALDDHVLFHRLAPAGQTNPLGLRGRWHAEMRRVALVSGDVLQHRVYSSRERRQFGEAGEYRAIADFAVDHKGRPLRDFQRVKLGRARPHSRFGPWRTRAFK